MSQMVGENKKIPSFEDWSAPLLRAAGMGAPASGNARPAPAVGDVVAGHRFRGGNPNDRTSWEAVR